MISPWNYHGRAQTKRNIVFIQNLFSKQTKQERASVKLTGV